MLGPLRAFVRPPNETRVAPGRVRRAGGDADGRDSSQKIAKKKKIAYLKLALGSEHIIMEDQL